MALTLEIITPDKKVYSDTINTAVIPTAEGEVGILSGHIPLLGILEPGEIHVAKPGCSEFLAVDKGFVRVLDDTISVLTEAAINVEDIDLSAVSEAEARAQKTLEEARDQGEDLDPSDVEHLESVIRFPLTQKLAKKNHL